MNEFLEIYQRIGYLRNKGVKMKEIADCIDMTPSVLSSLYTTVFPAYFEAVKKSSPDDALDYALSQVNNISRKRLMANLAATRRRTDGMSFCGDAGARNAAIHPQGCALLRAVFEL